MHDSTYIKRSQTSSNGLPERKHCLACKDIESQSTSFMFNDMKALFGCQPQARSDMLVFESKAIIAQCDWNTRYPASTHRQESDLTVFHYLECFLIESFENNSSYQIYIISPLFLRSVYEASKFSLKYNASLHIDILTRC